MLLALDTSTSDASIALVHDSHTLAELTWAVGQRHSTELLARLQWLLEWQDVSLSALDGVAVATGPGSFNGVRVAVTTAKSLAFALGIPLYGRPTLDVIAWGASLASEPLWAILEAGRGQVYAAQYTPAASAVQWAPATDYALLTPGELGALLERPAVICGEWHPETRAALEAAAHVPLRFAPRLGGRRASWLAELALARAAEGLHDDPAALEPLYLRRPAITTSAKKSLAAHTQQDNTHIHDNFQRSHREAGDGFQPLDGEGASRALPR